MTKPVLSPAWRWLLAGAVLAVGIALAAGPLIASSRAAACDEWASAVSGDWNVAGNWMGDVAPTPGQNVCITATGGTYTVTLTGDVSVGSLAVGSGATLAISTSNAVGAQLSLADDSSNSGTLDLTDSDPAGSGAATAEILIGSGATLTNDGTILSDQGNAGQGTRVINGFSGNSGTLDNAADGTIIVNQDLQIDSGQGGVFTTSGDITINSGEKLLVAPSGGVVSGTSASDYAPTLNIDGGTITDDGTFAEGISEAGAGADGTALDVSGGTISGTGSGLKMADGGYVTFAGAGSGTYTLVGTSNTSATLAGTIGANQTLALSADAAAGSVPVDVDSDVTNDGTIDLTDSDASAGGSVKDELLIGSGDTLTNDGTILSDPGAGGQGTRVIDGQSGNSGTLDNAAGGTITVDQDLQIDDGQAGVFTTSGNITINSGEKLLVAPSGGIISGSSPSDYTPTFNIAGGTITNSGTFAQGVSEAGAHADGSALDVTGGTIDGSFIVAGGGAASFSGAGSGTYTFEGSDADTELSGTIGSGQTVVLSANSAFGGVQMDASSDVTNNGTIELTDPDAPGGTQETARLRMDSGTLTNNGTLVTEAGGGRDGVYALDGNVTNSSTGTLQVNQTLEVDTQASVTSSVQTSGTVDVASGQTLYVNPVGNATTFTISGGTVTDTGNLDVNISPTTGQAEISGGLTVDGGTVTGNPVLAGDVGASFAGSGSGTFTLVGQQNLLSGDISAGCTVVLSASSTGAGSTTLTAADSFTNDGTIKLTDPDSSGSGSASTLLAITSGTLTNDGTIDSEPGPGGGPGTREISGSLLNNGTIDVAQTLELVGGGTLTSAGTTTVASGETLDLPGAFAQSSGTTDLNGTLDAPDGFNLEGGTLDGDGNVQGNLTNGGVVAPSPSPATLSVIGTYTQSSGGTLDANVTAAGNDELTVSGAATLGGTLQVGTASGFTPTLGNQYQVLTAASVSGTFATEAGLSTGPYSLAIGTSAVTLTALAQPAHPNPTLTISDPTVEAPAYGEAPATFTVTLSSAQTAPVSVDYATADGSGVAGTDYVATSGQLVFTPGETTQTITVDVIGGTLGTNRTFLVELTNPSGASLQNASATGTITHPAPNLSGGVEPSSGGNGGTVTVTISGAFLSGSPSVSLVAPGQPTITATGGTVSSDGTTMTATFDLSGATPGARSVVIVDGTASKTITNGFTVVPATEPQISVQIAGAAAIGPGAQWTGELLYSNAGNVDAYGTLVEISGFPQGTDVQVTGATGPVGGTDLAGGRTISFAIGLIPASSSGAIGITFTAPAGKVGSSAYLQPAVISTSADPSDAPDPADTITPKITTNTASELAGTVTISGPSGSITVAIDVKTVPAPSDGEPSVTTSGTGDNETVTELLPPEPPPGDFTAGDSLCETGGTITVSGGVKVVTEEPLGGCAGPASVFAEAVAERSSPTAHPADVPNPTPGPPSWDQITWSVITGKFSGVGAVAGAAQTYSATQAVANLQAFDACLQQAGMISPSQANDLDAATNGPFFLDLAGLMGDLAGGPAGGIAASVAETLVGSQLDRAWAGAVYNAVKNLDSNAGSQVIPNDMGGLPLPYSSDTVGALFANLYNNPAFMNCMKKKQPCKAPDVSSPVPPQGLTIPSFCPLPQPPEPPPFPIQIRSSLDPNDMVGPTGPGTKHWVAGTGRSPYTYTATFQNEPSATAPAYRVVVSDALNRGRFDLSTLHLGPVRVGTHLVTPPPGLQSWSTQIDLRPAQNAFVDVAGGLDAATGVLSWTFTTIDASTGQPITDAINGFLPPDHTPPDGEGSVSFTVTPHSGLRTGAAIDNLATIVFDTNKPLNTPTWVNEVDLSHPSSRIIAVRAPGATVRYAFRVGHHYVTRHVHVLHVSWRGTDRYSGIAGFELYIAAGRSAFARATGVTGATSARVVCTPGRQYRFYTVAFSAVGNVQAGHSRPSTPVTCG